jgi:hypothetical protein
MPIRSAVENHPNGYCAQMQLRTSLLRLAERFKTIRLIMSRRRLSQRFLDWAPALPHYMIGGIGGRNCNEIRMPISEDEKSTHGRAYLWT